MHVRSGIAALVLSAAALGVAAHADAGSDDEAGAFTEQELEHLHEGELVVRRVKEERGDLRLMGGSSYQVIDATPEVVWMALLDTPRYPRFLPQVVEAKLIKDEGRTRTLWIKHAGLMGPSYYLTLRLDPEHHRISFALDKSRPHDIRAAWGFYDVRAYDRDQALVAYGVRADIGDGLVSALLRPSVHRWMMRVPWLLKRFVEGSGRYLYRAAPVDAGLRASRAQP